MLMDFSQLVQTAQFLGGVALGLIVATLLFLLVLAIGAAKGGGAHEILAMLRAINHTLTHIATAVQAIAKNQPPHP